MPTTDPLRRSLPDSLADSPSEGTSTNFSERFTILPPTRTAETSALPMETEALPRIPGYDLLKVLGRGGMGVVYLARHLKLDRAVALKMVRGNPDRGSTLLERFRTEALAVARLNHPNITQVYDYGEWEGCPFLALEFVDGGTLADRSAGSPQPPREAARIVETLARAIQHAHEHGVVHRDLKPANILLAAVSGPLPATSPELEASSSVSVTGQLLAAAVKVTDFGLARWVEAGESSNATRDGDIVGTPSYMAPEQAGGVVRNLGPPCDIYALGAILYELLTGRPPFRGTSAFETVMQVLAMDPVPIHRLQPGVPRDLETVCLKCLEKEPRARYITANDLADDLARFLQGEPVHARPAGPGRRLAKWAKRRPVIASLSALSVLAVLVIFVGGAWYNARLKAERDRSENLVVEVTKERDRTEQLLVEGNKLVRWLLRDHVNALLVLRGSTPAQKSLIDELLGYLDILTAKTSDSSTTSGELTTEEIATAYERLADVQGNPNFYNLGQTPAAMASCKKALDLRRRVLANRPGDATAESALVESLVKLGQMQIELNAHDDARASFAEARAMADGLCLRDPSSRKHQVVRIVVLWNQADLHWTVGDRVEALRGHREVLDRTIALTGLNPTEPKHRTQLAASRSRVGSLLDEAGDAKGAGEEYRLTLELCRGVAGERPDDPHALRSLIQALIAYGDLLSQANDRRADVAACYQQALEFSRMQLKDDPSSATVRRSILISLERLSFVRLLEKDYPAAIGALTESLQISRELYRNDPKLPDNQRSVAIQLGKLADVLLQQSGRARKQLDSRVQQYWEGKTTEAEVESATEKFVRELAPIEDYLREKLRLSEDLLRQNPKSLPDWESVAESHLSLGTLRMNRMSPLAKDDRVVIEYKAVATSFRAAIEAYEQLARVAPLPERVKSTRDKCKQMLATIEGAIADILAPKPNPKDRQ